MACAPTTGMEVEGETSRTISFTELKKRLSLQTDDLKWMLKFLYGKNSKGQVLFDETKEIVYLELYTTSSDDLRSFLDKHKPFKSFEPLKAKLKDESGKKLMRGSLIRGTLSRKNHTEYVELVHEVACTTVKRTLVTNTESSVPPHVTTPKSSQVAPSLKDRITRPDVASKL